MTKTRLLIVEDEAITALDLKHELTALGYEIAGITGTTEEALQTAERIRPDLVLMDITLEGQLDGIIAATALRGSLHVPVVFLTAHADSRTMQRAMLAGPFGYLLKPFTGPELQAAIEVALHKHRTEREVQTLNKLE